MRRSTVILLVLFALLAGLTWEMQQPGNPISKALATSTPALSAVHETLINVNNGAIGSLQISDATGKTITLDKSSGTWMFNNGPADQSSAETASSMVYSMQIITKLEKAPDPAGTGLDMPAYIASINQQNGLTNLKIGKLAPTGSGYYVQTADGSIYVVGKESVDTFIGLLQNPPLPLTATPQP